MKKHLPIFLVFLIIVAAASVAAGAPAAQGPDEEQPPDEAQAGNEEQVTETPAAPEDLYTVVTVEPSISLPDGDPSFACFDMVVNLDAAATVVDVGVTVQHTHTKAGDLIYRLYNPDGEYLTMLNRPGFDGVTPGDTSNLLASAPITFSNAATDNAEFMGNGLDTDGVICQDDGRCHYFPSPGEDALSLHSFAQMVGATASGTWQFCASDNEAADSGLLEEVQMMVVYALPQVSACTTGEWEAIASLNTARSRPSVVFLEAGSKFYALGGETTGGARDIPIEEYDPATDTWTDKSELINGVSNAGAAAVDGYIYVPGGYTGTEGLAAMQRYDPVADEVTTVAPMPAANFAHGVTALAGKIYVMGGTSGGAEGTTNFIYDVASNTWDMGAPLPTAVNYAAVTTDGTYVYVLGGNTTNLATVQRYDPVADSWDTIADMNMGRGGAAAFFDGANIWAVNGGWAAQTGSTEYWNGVEWKTGPPTNGGTRTLGAAFGDGTAIKAGGWDGAYVAAAEALQISCETPEIAVDDTGVTATVRTGQVVTHTVTISNSGGADLAWSAMEAPPAPALPTGSGLVFYADRGEFEEDSPGLPVEDFEDSNVTSGGVLTCPAPVDENSDNVCFDPGDVASGILFQNDTASSLPSLALAGAGYLGSPSKALVTNFGYDRMEIYLTAPDVYAVGLDLHAFSGASTVDITIYGADGTTALGETTAAGTSGGVYWGVRSQTPIGRINLHSPAPGGAFEGVDNIAFGYAGDCSTPAELPWLSVSPENGTIAPGASQDVTLTLDSAGLEIGDTVHGTLCLSSNDPDEPHVTVAVSLTVEGWDVYLPAIFKP